MAPAAQEMVAQTVARLRPVILQAAVRIQQRPARVAARKREAKIHAAREELLSLRMRAFEREQRAGSSYVDPARKQQWHEKARVEEVRVRSAIADLTEPELSRSLQQAKNTEREHGTQRSAAIQFRGMDLSR